MLLLSEPSVNIVPNKDRLSPVKEVALPYFQDPILSTFPITPELLFFLGYFTVSAFSTTVWYGQATSSLPCALRGLNI